MAETFDPYHRWLSIPPEEQPPHHYRLLGLKLLEADPDVIESAADRQMTHVRTFQSGKFADHSQRILNEISTAKVALLDPTKKAAYDAALQAKLNEKKRVPKPDRPMLVAQPLPVAQPLAVAVQQPPSAQPPTVAPPTNAPSEPSFAHAGTSVSTAVRRRSNGTPLAAIAALGALALVVIAVLGAVAFIVRPWETPTPVAVNDHVNDDPTTLPPPVVPPVIPPPQEKPPRETPDPEETDPPDDEESTDPRDDIDLEEPLDDEPVDEEFVADVPVRVAVPPKAERDAKRASIDSIFQTAKAKTPAEKADLAAQLFRTAMETPDDAVAQFVMLNLARELAGDAARIQLAFDAIDLLEQQFEFDADAIRILTIAQGAKASVPNDAKQEVVTLGVELANQLAAADKYDEAGKVLNGLVELARRAREPQVAAVLVEHRRVNESLFAAFKAAQASFATLKQSPDDPAANLAVGRFYLFVKNDAARGLTHLAKATADPLAAAAKLELENPQAPEPQEQLADAWWNLAAKETDKDVQKKLQARAMAWYQRAHPNLKGLAAAKADKRLRELADAGVQPADINLDLGIFDDDPSAAQQPRWPANLLDLADVNLHSVSQIWERRGEEVAASDEGAALLRIPLDIDGSYVFRTELTRETGSETVGVSLPVAGHRCLFVLSAYNGGAGGLMLIDGRELRDTNNPARVAPNALTNGQRYVVEISVTVKGDQAAIAAKINGKSFCRWQGAASSLSVYGDHEVPAPQQIGLYSRISRTVFHNASLVVRDGTAAPAADAVLPAAIAKPRRLPANLLDLVDVDVHALKQKWTRNDESIVAPQAYAPLLHIPVTVAGSYELTVEFTRETGGDIVGVILPVGEMYCNVLLSTSGGAAAYVGDGAENKIERAPFGLTNGKRYTLRARVLAKGDASTVDVSVDDITFDRWTGAGTANDAGDRHMPQRGHIGLYAHDSETVFHLAKLTMLTGRATPDADARRVVADPSRASSDVTRGLVAHWKFDEADGVIARDDVGGHEGTIRGAAWVKGIRGGALSFDGRDDFVAISNDEALNFEGPITLCAYVRPRSLPPAGNGDQHGIMNLLIHGYAEGMNNEVYLRIFHRESGQCRYETGGFTGHEISAVCAAPDSDVGVWTHWTATYDGQAWRLYRNGKLEGLTESDVGAVAVPADWGIGGHSNKGSRFFHGDIDDVRIYNRGLSADEVKTLYLGKSSTASVPRVEPRPPPDKVDKDLVAHWKFDEGRGTAARDAVGGEAATIDGATWTEGKLGGALNFDGKTSAVAIADRDDLNFGGPLTMAAWIRPERMPKGISFMNVLAHGGASGKGETYLRVSNSQYAVGYYAGTHDPTEKRVPDADIGAWIHLAGVYDGESWHIYRSGELFHTHKSKQGPQPFAGPWAIGASPNNQDRMFQGDIDDVRIYRRALTADEIKALADDDAADAPAVEAGSSLPTFEPPPRDAAPTTPLPERVIVKRAMYGVDTRVTDVTEYVARLLSAEPFVPLQPDGRAFGDPAHGVKKELVVDYEHGGRRQTARVAEGEVLPLPTLPASGLVVRGAAKDFQILAARFGAGLTWYDITDAVRERATAPDQVVDWNFHKVDPWFGVYKHYCIWFDYRGRRYVRVFLDGATQALSPNATP